jgi:DNA-binding response OmpR family regulator
MKRPFVTQYFTETDASGKKPVSMGYAGSVRGARKNMAVRIVIGQYGLAVVLDRESHRVFRKKAEVKLGPTEFRLLEFMMRHPGRVFSRGQLLDNVWGETIYIDERTVDVHVGRLRKALVQGDEADPLRTVRGAGYSFDETFGKR